MSASSWLLLFCPYSFILIHITCHSTTHTHSSYLLPIQPSTLYAHGTLSFTSFSIGYLLIVQSCDWLLWFHGLHVSHFGSHFVVVLKSNSAAQVIKHVRPLLSCVGPYTSYNSQQNKVNSKKTNFGSFGNNYKTPCFMNLMNSGKETQPLWK